MGIIYRKGIAYPDGVFDPTLLPVSQTISDTDKVVAVVNGQNKLVPKSAIGGGGSGSGTPSRDITWAAYQNLTQEEKMSDTDFYVTGAPGGGADDPFVNDTITTYFEPYNNRVNILADRTYTYKDTTNNRIYMSCEVLLQAIVTLSGMSSLIRLKSGYRFPDTSSIAPINNSSRPTIDDDRISLNKQSTNYPNHMFFRWIFDCYFDEV